MAVRAKCSAFFQSSVFTVRVECGHSAGRFLDFSIFTQNVYSRCGQTVRDLILCLQYVRGTSVLSGKIQQRRFCEVVGPSDYAWKRPMLFPKSHSFPMGTPFLRYRGNASTNRKDMRGAPSRGHRPRVLRISARSDVLGPSYSARRFDPIHVYGPK